MSILFLYRFFCSHPRKQLKNPRSTSALKLPQSSHNIILFMNPLNLSSTLPSFKSLSFCDCDKQNAWEYKQKSHIECEEWKQVFINSKINSDWWFGPSVGRCTSYLFIYKCMHPNNIHWLGSYIYCQLNIHYICKHHNNIIFTFSYNIYFCVAQNTPKPSTFLHFLFNF